MTKRASLSFAVWALAGCASTAAPDSPAVLIAPTSETRTELFEAVAATLARRDIVLSDDALTRSSVLLIERRPARDPTGQRLSGRELELPEEFRLLMRERRCMLIHERTGRRIELKTARCAPSGQ